MNIYRLKYKTRNKERKWRTISWSLKKRRKMEEAGKSLENKVSCRGEGGEKNKGKRK